MKKFEMPKIRIDEMEIADVITASQLGGNLGENEGDLDIGG